MGISSNQARFLSLTARQVDLENRVQQICQRRLRLSSELERVATDYNNQIGNRQMFAFNSANSGISALTIANVQALKDTNGKTYQLLCDPAGGNTYATVPSVGVTAAGILTVNGVNTTYNIGLSAGNEPAILEAAIRAGAIKIATQADEFTQTSYTVGATPYELRDWRTLPDIADELYKGDDMDAENKYDRIVSQINQQDKKLQLEQASVEVEYKAISSEKEAVKKILDTNASTSFKYFS